MTPAVRKILLIDDDPDERVIFQDALSALHPSFELQWIDQDFKKPQDRACNIPDIAFVDVMMPRENGFQWVRKLRAGGYTFPIVMYTHSGSEDDRHSAYDAGATLFVTKPVNFRDLVAELEQLLFTHDVE